MNNSTFYWIIIFSTLGLPQLGLQEVARTFTNLSNDKMNEMKKN